MQAVQGNNTALGVLLIKRHNKQTKISQIARNRRKKNT